MGEVVEVPGLTENELRRIAAMERTRKHVEIAPVLGPDEYGIKDWIEFIKEREGRTLSPSTATRQLDELVDDKIMAKGDRQDERVGRVVVGYWFVEGA